MSTIENGSSSSWSYPERTATLDEMEEFWQVYFAPYIRTLKTESGPITIVEPGNTEVEKSTHKIYFQDGSSVYFYSAGSMDFIYDVNSDQGPDVLGLDRFDFLLDKTNGKFTAYIYTGQLDEESEDYTMDVHDRENVLNLCKNTNPQYCSQLLFLDNWEFKDDYPYDL